MFIEKVEIRRQSVSFRLFNLHLTCCRHSSTLNTRARDIHICKLTVQRQIPWCSANTQPLTAVVVAICNLVKIDCHGQIQRSLGFTSSSRDYVQLQLLLLLLWGGLCQRHEDRTQKKMGYERISKGKAVGEC